MTETKTFYIVETFENGQWWRDTGMLYDGPEHDKQGSAERRKQCLARWNPKIPARVVKVTRTEIRIVQP